MRRSKKLFLAFVVLLLILRVYFAYSASSEKFITGERIETFGRVIKPPEETKGGIKIVAELIGLKRFGKNYPLRATIFIISRDDDIEYGDVIEIRGVFEKPFADYPRFDAYIQNPQIKILARNTGNYFFAGLFRFKKFLIQRFYEIFPEPAASFFPGLILGYRSAIPQGIIDDFRKTGLSHIIALSGYNIVILIVFISSVFSFLPRRAATILTIFTIIVFTLLVGAGASVVRAAIMASLSLVARIFGRNFQPAKCLFIAAYIMAFLDPYIVFYDIGFQLSFAATAGLILFANRWQERFKFMPNAFGVRDSFLTTCAAQVFTLPIIFVYFRGISIVAPVANVIVLPFVPLLMLGGGLSLLFGKIAAAPAWLLFKIFIFIIQVFASLPFSFFDFRADSGIL